jgi:hypothetical protein
MAINLDNFKKKSSAPAQATGSNMGLTLASRSGPKPPTDLMAAPTSTNALAELYGTQVYLFDISSSMNTPLELPTGVESWDWDTDHAKAMLAKLADGNLVASIIRHYGSPVKDMVNACAGKSPDEIKLMLTTDHYTAGDLGFVLKPRDSKMQVVKTEVVKIVKGKRAKAPNSDIRIVQFNENAIMLTPNGPGVEDNMLFDSIEGMTPHGCTDILQAVELGLNALEQRPSPMKSNKLILVTDGEDYSAVEIGKYLDRMKKLNVQFDYIFIRPQAKQRLESGSSQVATEMEKICKETGGEYVEVNSKLDFGTKFLAAATRLCLPPASISN